MRFRRPLFWRHDFSSIFEGTQNSVLKLALHTYDQGGIDPGWIHDTMVSGRVRGLWLDRRGLGLETELFGRDRSGEPRLAYYQDYRFLGDVWLWDINPGESLLVYGQVATDTLTLSTIARSEEDALAYFENELQKIQSLIDLQWKCIADYEDELYEAIKTTLVAYRDGDSV